MCVAFGPSQKIGCVCYLSSLSQELASGGGDNLFDTYLLVATGTAKSLCQVGAKEGSRKLWEGTVVASWVQLYADWQCT